MRLHSRAKCTRFAIERNMRWSICHVLCDALRIGNASQSTQQSLDMSNQRLCTVLGQLIAFARF